MKLGTPAGHGVRVGDRFSQVVAIGLEREVHRVSGTEQWLERNEHPIRHACVRLAGLPPVWHEDENASPRATNSGEVLHRARVVQLSGRRTIRCAEAWVGVK